MKKTPSKKTPGSKTLGKKTLGKKTPGKKAPGKKMPRKKTAKDRAVAAVDAVLLALDKVERDVGQLGDCAPHDVAEAS